MATRVEQPHVPAWQRGKVAGWLVTVDHKRIGILYLGTAGLFLALSGFLALLIRTQLARPDNGVITGDSYNEVVTMHGTGMVFFVMVPVLAGLGNGGWSVLPAAITADIVDYDELGTAERRAGAYFGVWTLVMKLAAALAAGVVGVSFQLLGYVPNVEQAPGTILGIRLLYGPIPAAFLLVALAVFWRFPLTRDRHREVQAVLARRRAG